MRANLWRAAVLALVAVLALSGLAAAAAPKYRYYEIHPLGGHNSSAWGINSLGQVTGMADIYGHDLYGMPLYHAFIWSRSGGMRDLGAPRGYSTDGYYINDRGQVAGTAYSFDETSYPPFFWSAATRYRLLTAPGGGDMWAAGLSNLGQVCGYYYVGTAYRAFLWSVKTGLVTLYTPGYESYAQGMNKQGLVVGTYCPGPGLSPFHAALWSTPGAVQDLGSLTGPTGSSMGSDVNSLGQVVGMSYVDGYHYHPFLWTKPGPMEDLGVLGYVNGWGLNINDQGQVIGLLEDGTYHAFFWSRAGGMKDIGTFGGTYSYPYALNYGGQVVGAANNAGGESRAFLWTEADGLMDLNDLTVNRPAGVVLAEAHAINNQGWITGTANVSSLYGRGFVLVPIK